MINNKDVTFAEKKLKIFLQSVFNKQGSNFKILQLFLE